MSDFIAYQYDDQGFYVGEVNCQRDPRQNKPLLPRNCTFIRPPEAEGYIWLGDQWLEVEKEVFQPQKDQEEILLQCAQVLKAKPNKEELKNVIKKLMEMI